jgi:hypothetical protein
LKQTLEVNGLRDILLLAKAALEDKGLMDFTGNFIFYNQKIYSGNDKIVVMGPSPFEFNFSVNGNDLLTVLDGAQNNVDFTLKEHHLQIKCGKRKAKLSLADLEAPLSWLKQSGLDKDADWKEIPSGFLIALDWCKFSASKDVSYKPHTCLKVIENRVISTDGIRMSRYTMEGKMDIECLIPKETVSVIVGFPGITQYALFGTSWLCFRETKNNMICGVRLVIGDLPPNCEALFSNKGKKIQLPEDLNSIIKRAGKFVEGITEESKVIEIRISKGEIVCSGTKETGTFDQGHNIKYDGPDISFLVLPALLEQILGKVDSITLSDKLYFKVGPFEHLMVIASPVQENQPE